MAQSEKFKRRSQRTRFQLRKKGGPRTIRLSVHRSANHIYAQVIDDTTGNTLAAASSQEKDAKLAYGGNVKAAEVVGKLVAERAKAAKIETVKFDRGGFIYHGRVKALADAAREAGLNF
ncbi:MAG: 50S ribosomal protein L18 [Rickettsiales bacterium]|nr:50S ribosomal protein L18 [Rickettsiales bacterium]